MKRSTEYKITLAIVWLIVLALSTNCGQTIKTKNEHTYHFDTIKIQTDPIVITGEVYIKIVSTLTNDPVIQELINNTCQGKLTCNEQTLQDLLASITASLTSGTMRLEQPIK